MELVKEENDVSERELLQDNVSFINYKGNIFYYTDFIHCAEKGELLLKAAEAAHDFLVLGFDIEWPFSFQTGSGKSAVIQISPSLEDCYIFQISKITNLPKTITELLAHPKVKLTGINIKNDIRKLSKDFKGIDTKKTLANCIDLGTLANKVVPFSQRWSMQKLVEYFLKMRVNKDNSVRMSKWHIVPLSKAQLEYAAIDAYASLKLYQDIKNLETELEKENITN